MDAVTREEITRSSSTLDCNGREVEVGDNLLQAWAWAEIYLQHLCLAVRINRHIEQFALWSALRQVVNLITRDALNGTTLHHNSSTTTIAIEDIVYRALVVTFKYTDVVDILIEEVLVCHLFDDIATILEDYNHIVNIATIADKLGILHTLTNTEEALCTINIELSICHRHLCSLNHIKLSDFGLTLTTLAVLLAYALIVCNGVVGQVIQIILRSLDILLNLLYLVIGLIGIVARDTDELKLCQTLHILHRNLTTQLLLEWLQALIHSLIGSLACATTLDQLIELVLNEDTLQRCSVPSLIELTELDLKLQTE